MAVLHILSFVDPNDMGLFPPSVLASPWYDSLTTYITNHNISDNLFSRILSSQSGKYLAFVFDNEEAYQSFKSTCGLTDPTLISDIDAWCAAHSVSYEHKAYTITETGSIDSII